MHDALRFCSVHMEREREGVVRERETERERLNQVQTVGRLGVVLCLLECMGAIVVVPCFKVKKQGQ